MTTLVKRRNGDLLPTLKTDFFGNSFLAPNLMDLDNDLWDGGSTIPMANISETKDEYKVEISAPGLKREDFVVEIENGILSVTSEKKEEKKEEGETFKRREFSYNGFCRTFELPENVLEDKVNAKYDNGMLRISIPKKEVSASKPKKAIKVA